MTVVSNPNEYSVEGLVDTGSGNQRVIMTQSVNGTQQAYSETSVECIVEDSSGNKQRCVCVNDFGGGGGSGGVTSVNGQTGAVTLGADDVLPSQTGNSGKFITTDGTNASWGAINALQNTATGTNAITILGTVGTYNGSVNIGDNSSVGNEACVAIGPNSMASGLTTTAIGSNAQVKLSRQAAVAIGSNASVIGNGSIAIGHTATCSGAGSICLGVGSNTSESGIFNVSLAPTGFAATQYKLLGSDGTIPAARHATLPASDGTYTLKLTISDGTPTLSWVAD